MSFMVSEEVTVKEGGPRMIVTGYSSGMVECRWYDGYGVKREAFHETELGSGGGESFCGRSLKGYHLHQAGSHPAWCANACNE